MIRAIRCLAFQAAGLAIISLVPCQPATAADEPKAREIMQRVDDRDDGDNQTSNLQMILIDKQGNQRVRTLKSLEKDVGVDTHSMLFFLSPPDIQDTGFLTYDYDDADHNDDQWLYLPALKKTKRIASSDKSSAFMGSDFSYADMTQRPIERYEYRLLKESEVNGHPVWIIEATPIDEDEIDETGYTKSIQFVRKDNYFVIRSKIWLEKGNRNKYMEVQELEKIDEIWVATLMTMTTKNRDKTLHKTVLRRENVKFGQELEVDDFSIRTLETGP